MSAYLQSFIDFYLNWTCINRGSTFSDHN